MRRVRHADAMRTHPWCHKRLRVLAEEVRQPLNCDNRDAVSSTTTGATLSVKAVLRFLLIGDEQRTPELASVREQDTSTGQSMMIWKLRRSVHPLQFYSTLGGRCLANLFWHARQARAEGKGLRDDHEEHFSERVRTTGRS